MANFKWENDEFVQDAWEALDEDFGNSIGDPESVQLEELENLKDNFDNIISFLEMALMSSFTSHVIDGKLTMLTPTATDIIH